MVSWISAPGSSRSQWSERCLTVLAHAALPMQAMMQPGLWVWKGVNPGQEAAIVSWWATGSHITFSSSPFSLSVHEPIVQGSQYSQISIQDTREEKKVKKTYPGDPCPFLWIATTKRREKTSKGDFLMLQRFLLICGVWVRGLKRKTFMLLKRW